MNLSHFVYMYDSKYIGDYKYVIEKKKRNRKVELPMNETNTSSKKIKKKKQT